MSDLPELLAFAGVLALGQFSPGPDMMLLTRTALKDGVRAGVVMAWGIATGLVVHAALAIGGLAAIFERSDWLRQSLRWAAACYLGWLGYRMFVEWFVHVYSGSRDRECSPEPARNAFVQGLLCNLLNPKVVVFLAAVTAPFLAGDRSSWWPWALWTVVVVEGLTLWALWAAMLQIRSIRDAYRRSGPWITLGFGLVLIGLAVTLVLG